MGHVSKVLAVTGLSREGLVLRDAGVDVIAGGGHAASLEAELVRAADGAAGLISFGMAGALDPTLRLGDWVVCERVTGGFEAFCDQRWARALRESIPSARFGTVFADGHMIASPEEKKALRGAHDAIAVDMESHVVAAAAAKRGVPFAILRCISDEASAALPPAVTAAMRADGSVDIPAILKSIAGTPGQVPALIRTAVRFRRAYAALSAGARAAGPRLGFDRR